MEDVLHSLHLNDRLASGFFPSMYVLVSNDPFFTRVCVILILHIEKRVCWNAHIFSWISWSYYFSSQIFQICQQHPSPTVLFPRGRAITLSTLTLSKHNSWGAMSSGIFAPPIGIKRVLSSSSSRVSSRPVTKAQEGTCCFKIFQSICSKWYSSLQVFRFGYHWIVMRLVYY